MWNNVFPDIAKASDEHTAIISLPQIHFQFSSNLTSSQVLLTTSTTAGGWSTVIRSVCLSVCPSVCTSVCLSIYLSLSLSHVSQKNTFRFHYIFCTQSSSNGNVIRYVLPVLWIMSRRVCFVKFARCWHRGRNLRSPTFVEHCNRFYYFCHIYTNNGVDLLCPLKITEKYLLKVDKFIWKSRAEPIDTTEVLYLNFVRGDWVHGRFLSQILNIPLTLTKFEWLHHIYGEECT